MKLPKWLPGQGGPEPDAGGGEKTRSERVQRERLRAQRRLAAKAKAGEGSGEAPTGKSESKDEPKSKRPVKPKLESKPESKRTPESESKRKPERGRGRGRKPARARSRDRAASGGGQKRSSSPRVRAVKAGAGLGSALKQGLQATRSSGKGVPTRLARGGLAALGAVYAIFFDLLGFVLNVLIAIGLFLAGPCKAALSGLRWVVRFASRVVTPARVLTLAAAAAAVLLALSQFADYRSVSVGTDAYDEVATVAPAPERERAETGSAHSYLMVPLAGASLLLLGAAAAGRRWRLCRLVALAGVVAIIVALLVDRPAGLDSGQLELQYDGVEARLLGGFYAQLFSGLVLATSALLLGRELRLAGAAKPARDEPRKERRRLLRRPPKPQGARA